MLYGISITSIFVIIFFNNNTFEESSNPDSSDSQVRNRVSTLVNKYSFLIMLIVFVIYIFQDSRQRFSSESITNFTNSVILLLDLVFILIIYQISKDIEKKSLDTNRLFIAIIILSLQFLISSGYDKSLQVKQFKSFNKITFVLKSVSYSTSDSLSLIGKTEKYIFWYTKGGDVHIRPVGELSEMEIFLNE